MSANLRIPSQVSAACELCRRQNTKSLIQVLELKGSAKSFAISMCDFCIGDLKEAVKEQE